MSAKRYTFDTNILFYALDDRAPEKHLHARRLVGEADPGQCVVMLQSLGELCSTTAKKRRDLLPVVERTVSATGRLYQVIGASPADLLEGLLAQREHQLPFWDAVLWATARRAGCTLLLSEDFQDGRSLGGVLFRNPMRLSRREIIALLG